MSDLFTTFRRQPNFSEDVASRRHKPVSVTFQLQFDNDYAYVETIDSKGNACTPDFRDYGGAQRSLLRAMQAITDEQNFAVDWENPESRIYLHQHPHLVPMLLESDCFIDSHGAPLSLHPSLARLRVTLQEEHAQRFAATMDLHAPEKSWRHFQFINENHAYLPDDHLIVKTSDVGMQFGSLNLFETTFPESELRKYLSILFSHVQRPELVYQSYTVHHLDEPLRAEPALIFERIDVDNLLYLRVQETVPQATSDFLDDYDVSHIVGINDLEKTVQVRPIQHIALGRYMDSIEKTLRKYATKDAQATTYRDLFIIPEAVALPFIYRELPALLRQYVVAGAEKLREYKVQTTPPKLSLSLGSGIDFLEGSAALDFGEEEIDLFDAISQYKKNRYILLSDGSHAIVNDAYMNKLQRIFKKRKEGVKISFFDLPLVEELLDEKTSAASFQVSRDIFRGFNALHTKKVLLPQVNASLRPYQKQGYAWLEYLYQHHLGGCLADDMGLGKTLQTITLLAKVYENETLPSLIVLPKSLLFNWQEELRRFAPQLKFHVYYGSDRQLAEAVKHQLILTTYATVRNDIEKLRREQFCYVVLDESQNIKNSETQNSRAVTLLQSKHRLALSGTPIENNLGELYSLFRFLNPAMFESAESFRHDYMNPIQKDSDESAANDLRRKIHPFILRRLKREVLTELPDKSEQILYIEMSPAQARLYEQRRRFYKDAIEMQVKQKGIAQTQFFVFQALNELRQIASIPEVRTEGKVASPKVELLLEQIAELVASGRKALVFANYLGAVEKIGEELDRANIDFVSMTGSTRDRQQVVERFQNDPSCMVFVMTLKTGGQGLNLTAADTVFIFDPWWNKAAENQAIDRAHRIGRSQKVFCYRIIAKDTIEEKILQLQEMKNALFENIIASDSASLKSLSEEDISYILGN